MTSTDEHADGRFPACWKCLRVPDRRRRQGRGYLLAFVLAVAVGRVLAWAKSLREIGDQAADLPQEIRIIAPSETPIRILIHAIGGDALDGLANGCLRALGDASRPDHLLTQIAGR